MFGILAFAEGAFAELTDTGNIEVSAIGVNATGGVGALSAQGTTLLQVSGVSGTATLGDEVVSIDLLQQQQAWQALLHWAMKL